MRNANNQSSWTQLIGDKVMTNEQPVIVLDLDSTRRNFDGDASLIRDIGQIFVEDVPPLIRQLVAMQTRLHDAPSADALIFDDVRRLAHSVKGLANTFGAEPLGSLLAEIEQEPERLIAPDSGERLRVLESVAQQTVEELARCLSSDI